MEKEIAITNKPMGKQRRKYALSLEDKRSLYEQWRASGQKRHDFCKNNGLPVSTFYGWSRELEPLKEKSSCHKFIPVIDVSQQVNGKNEKQDQANVEMILPNQTIIRITLPIHRTLSFVQELYHAATIIR
jgi:hypothetical protein